MLGNRAQLKVGSKIDHDAMSAVLTCAQQHRRKGPHYFRYGKDAIWFKPRRCTKHDNEQLIPT